MDWAEIVRSTGQLIRAAQVDFLASQETLIASQAGAADRALAHGAGGVERDWQRRRVARITELHAQRELLRLAPPGAPGVDAALRNLEVLLRKAKA